jgi:hypothetical protein
MMEVIRVSESSVLTEGTRRHIPDDGILHNRDIYIGRDWLPQIAHGDPCAPAPSELTMSSATMKTMCGGEASADVTSSSQCKVHSSDMSETLHCSCAPVAFTVSFILQEHTATTERSRWSKQLFYCQLFRQVRRRLPQLRTAHAAYCFQCQVLRLGTVQCRLWSVMGVASLLVQTLLHLILLGAL